MIFNRVWAMPNHNTFSIKPIGEMVDRYLSKADVSIDPFARDATLATYTNDLNPDTNAMYHLDAAEFLQEMVHQGIRANLVLFDPPYSPRQIKECYDGIGLKMAQMDAFRTHWKPERDLIDELLTLDGVVLSLGWNSIGMGCKRNFEIVEVLLVCHGPGHNDTICIAEKRIAKQLTPDSRFPDNAINGTTGFGDEAVSAAQTGSPSLNPPSGAEYEG